MVDFNVKELRVKAPTSAPGDRRLDEIYSDEYNVKMFGAVGNGIADDRQAIQRCFNAAFTNATTPFDTYTAANGKANANLNHSVFFPPGRYLVGAPLLLKDVYGASIRGSGRWTTQLYNQTTGNGSVLVCDGLSQCSIREMTISSNGSTGIALDLDWPSGPTGVGLSHNLFENVEFGGWVTAVRIAHAGQEGHNNQFLHCNVGGIGNGSGQGYLIEGAAAYNQYIVGGNASNAVDVVIKCTGGSFRVEDLALQVTTTQDIYVSSTSPCSIIGCRSESVNFITGINATIYCGSCFHPGASASRGLWANSTTYAVNQSVYSNVDYKVYTCTVAHTSATSPTTFAQDRAGAASGKWNAGIIGAFANLTDSRLSTDCCTSGQPDASLMGGILIGNTGSKFYSRVGIFTRDVTTSNDFYTAGPFNGTHTAGTFVV